MTSDFDGAWYAKYADSKANFGLIDGRSGHAYVLTRLPDGLIMDYNPLHYGPISDEKKEKSWLVNTANGESSQLYNDLVKQHEGEESEEYVPPAKKLLLGKGAAWEGWTAPEIVRLVGYLRRATGPPRDAKKLQIVDRITRKTTDDLITKDVVKQQSPASREDDRHSFVWTGEKRICADSFDCSFLQGRADDSGIRISQVSEAMLCMKHERIMSLIGLDTSQPGGVAGIQDVERRVADRIDHILIGPEIYVAYKTSTPVASGSVLFHSYDIRLKDGSQIPKQS